MLRGGVACPDRVSSRFPVPVARFLERGLSSAGRAPALHAGGHRFDPDRLHQVRARCW